MCNDNPDPWTSPGEHQLPLDKRHLEAARAAYRRNKGDEGMFCFSIALQVGACVELRDDIVRVFVWRGVPTAIISDAFGLTGREVQEIVAADPISEFECLECEAPLPVRSLPDLKRMKRAIEAASKASTGTLGSAALFCGACTEAVLERLKEQAQQDRRVREARIWELNNKMTYSQYLETQDWKATKAAALARAKHRCQVCNGNDEELHVHHRIYTRRGCERPENLIVLCRSHHAQFHGLLSDAS